MDRFHCFPSNAQGWENLGHCGPAAEDDLHLHPSSHWANLSGTDTGWPTDRPPTNSSLADWSPSDPVTDDFCQRSWPSQHSTGTTNASTNIGFHRNANNTAQSSYYHSFGQCGWPVVVIDIPSVFLAVASFAIFSLSIRNDDRDGYNNNNVPAVPNDAIDQIYARWVNSLDRGVPDRVHFTEDHNLKFYLYMLCCNCNLHHVGVVAQW